MHAALQFLEQREQFLHFFSSKRIFRKENRAKNESIVPTGQMVLQYVRPPRQARINSTTSVADAMISTGSDFIHTSTV